MRVRYYEDPSSGQPHIYGHDVAEDEVEAVLACPLEDRRGEKGARIALGQTQAGRYLRVVYVPDPVPNSVFVITAFELGPKAKRALRRRCKGARMRKKHYPAGWDERQIQQVIDHYEAQSDEEAAVEDESATDGATHTAVEVPADLVPEIRELLAKRQDS